MKKKVKCYIVTAVTASFSKDWFTVKSAEKEIQNLVTQEGYGLDGDILRDKFTKTDYVFSFGVTCDYRTKPTESDFDVDACNVGGFGDMTVPARSLWIVDDQFLKEV